MKKRFRKEYDGAALKDARRSERLAELGMMLAAVPSASFPEALGDGAALEAAYRFLSNDAVQADAILGPHIQTSAERCHVQKSVIIAHDTTEFVFPGETRRGLGRMQKKTGRGFFAHVAFATASDEHREPLGVLHLETWTRSAVIKNTAKISPRERQRDPERESTRWARGIEAVEKTLKQPDLAIHVMDREADDYQLLAALTQGGHHFVVRSKADRRVQDAPCLTAALATQPIVCRREVPLTARRRSPLPKQRKTHPARAARLAMLGIKAGTVRLLRPRDLSRELPETLELRVVLVEEINTPDAETPVQWRLYTTEPIDTAAALGRILDAYRGRWQIEEYFKVLKTGCAIEKRQLETGHALINALAVYMPIAWRVLRHRTLARANPGAPATTVLSTLQLRILRRVSKVKMAPAPTQEESLRAIAAMGGHLARNGPPGWMTIVRGYDRLLTLEEGATLALQM